MEVDRGRNCYACGGSGICPDIVETEGEDQNWGWQKTGV